MGTLDRIEIRRTALTGKIVLARFGKDPNLALEQREAQNEFWQTLIAFAFDGKMPGVGQAVEVKVGGGDEQFTVTVRRIPALTSETSR